MVVLLVAPDGTRPAWAFTAAWVASLALVATLVLLLADGADASENGAPATWVSVVKVVVGLALVAFAARQWHGRDAARAEAPGWLRKLDDADAAAARAAGLAVLLAAVKPKNLLLTVGAAVAVAQVGASAGGQVAAVAVYLVLASAGLAIPLAVHLLTGDRGRSALIATRDTLVRENATIVAVLSLVIAAKLLGDAVVALTG